MDLKLAKKLIVQTNQYYAHNAHSFAGARQRGWPLMLTLLQYIKKGDRVLDLGCGSGRFFPLVQQQGAHYLGIDFSRTMLSEARRMYPQAEFRLGDILDLPKFDQPFDIIIVLAVLHHLPHKEMREKAVRNIAANLQAGGYALVSNWNLARTAFWKQRWTQIGRRILRRNQLGWRDTLYGGKRYYHGFRKREIVGLLRQAGLKIIKNYYEKDGRRVNRWSGKNLVTIAQK